jgi:hypothetical protein
VIQDGAAWAARRIAAVSFSAYPASSFLGSGMRRHGLRAKIYPTLHVMALTMNAAAVLVAGASRVDASGLSAVPILRPTFAAIHTHVWWIVPLFICLAALFSTIRKHVGEPWVWDTIHHLMNTYRDFVFSDERNENRHHHRVTLFRFHRVFHYPCFLVWPWESRLIPVARSGHATQNTDTTFVAPDDADRAEGFAGKTWATFSTMIVNDLPDLDTDSSDEAVQFYAKQAFFSEDWLRRRIKAKRINGRSFCGIPIRVKGREWGVIVIDSRSPKSIKKEAEAHYDVMGKVLSKLLERV